MGRLLTVIAALAIFAYLRNRRPSASAVRSEGTRFAGELTEEEPVLGFDGMDTQTVISWLESSNLDRATLQRIRSYERAHRGRGAVLVALDGMID